MRRTATALTLCLALGAGAAPSFAAPTAEAFDALRHYLFVDCEVGEEGVALSDVLRHSGPLQPEFERLLVEGPAGPLLEEVAAERERQWEERTAFLESNPRLGLDPDARLAVVTTTRSEFVERSLRRFDLMCREKSATALGAIGTADARRALRQALLSVDEDVRDLILTVLRRSRPVGRDQPRLRDTRDTPTARRTGPGR
jgi:hypothetical protein